MVSRMMTRSSARRDRTLPSPTVCGMNAARPSSHGCRVRSIRACCGRPTAAAPGHDDENRRSQSVDFRATSSSARRGAVVQVGWAAAVGRRRVPLHRDPPSSSARHGAVVQVGWAAAVARRRVPLDRDHVVGDTDGRSWRVRRVSSR